MRGLLFSYGFAARRQRAESVDISDTYERLRDCGKLDTI
jgi:hypothetical protein